MKNTRAGEVILMMNNETVQSSDPRLPMQTTATEAIEGEMKNREDVGSLITSVGRRLGEAWQHHNYDETAFPELAQNALTTGGLHPALNARTVAHWLMHERHQPTPGSNAYGNFGQPSVTLYSEPDSGAGFFLEALVWLDATTSIHQHSFTGAFMVAEGSSVHTQYDFTVTDAVRDDLLIGDLKWRSSEVLKPGDVHQIKAGSEYIHSLFHMDHPSVTLVARTYDSRDIQFEYHPPNVAVNPFRSSSLTDTRRKMLAALSQFDRPNMEDLAEFILESADLWTTRQILHDLFPIRDQAVWGRAVKAAIKRHGNERIHALLGTFTEVWRQNEINAQRRNIFDPGHRFLLAMLISVPSRSRILSLVSGAYPKIDPIEQVLTWLQELSVNDNLGFPLTPRSTAMLRMIMGGASFNDLCSALGGVIPECSDRDELHGLWSQLHEISLISPLLER